MFLSRTSRPQSGTDYIFGSWTLLVFRINSSFCILWSSWRSVWFSGPYKLFQPSWITGLNSNSCNFPYKSPKTPKRLKIKMQILKRRQKIWKICARNKKLRILAHSLLKNHTRDEGKFFVFNQNYKINSFMDRRVQSNNCRWSVQINTENF